MRNTWTDEQDEKLLATAETEHRELCPLREMKTHQLKSPGMATPESCLDWLDANGADMTTATIHRGPDGFFRGSAMRSEVRLSRPERDQLDAEAIRVGCSTAELVRSRALGKGSP
jgi:hypothetical protein